MRQISQSARARSRKPLSVSASGRSCAIRAILGCALGLSLAAMPAAAQVLTIDTSGRVTSSTGHGATVDRRFAQIEPTHVPLPQSRLDARSRIALIRYLEVEPGFAMRPFPGGHKGLTLVANGKLDPAGEAYLQMVTDSGLSAKPGDKVVITDVKIQRSSIVFQLNGGPDLKHRFLRHIEIGDEVYTQPIIQDDGSLPTGARLTLVFPNQVPDLTGEQVEKLLAPLISFQVKAPVEAFTDTLPPMLKNAILNHRVLVGMSTDMVLFAKGHPDSKVREMDGQMPFEEWIYGKPPQDVEFIRINGNRVIRVEVAVVGKPPVIFTKDVVEGMMRTDGTPLMPPETADKHTIELGDVHRDADTQAPAPPPSLRNDGEKLPSDDDKSSRVGIMKPVQFPKQEPDDTPVAHQPGAQPAQAPAGSSAPAASPGPASPAPAPSQPSSATAPAEAGPGTSSQPNKFLM